MSAIGPFYPVQVNTPDYTVPNLAPIGLTIEDVNKLDGITSGTDDLLLSTLYDFNHHPFVDQLQAMPSMAVAVGYVQFMTGFNQAASAAAILAAATINPTAAALALYQIARAFALMSKGLENMQLGFAGLGTGDYEPGWGLQFETIGSREPTALVNPAANAIGEIRNGNADTNVGPAIVIETNVKIKDSNKPGNTSGSGKSNGSPRNDDDGDDDDDDEKSKDSS